MLGTIPLAIEDLISASQGRHLGGLACRALARQPLALLASVADARPVSCVGSARGDKKDGVVLRFLTAFE